MNTIKLKAIGLLFLNLFVLQIHSQGLLFKNNDGVVDVIMSKNVVSIVPTDNLNGLNLVLKDGSEKVYSSYSLGNLETFNFQDNMTALSISNGTASEITSTTATIKGVSTNFTFNLSSSFRMYVLYGKTNNLSPDFSMNAYSTTTNRSCDIKLNKLSPATQYYYQTFIKLNGKYYMGEMKSFTTDALPVSITVTTKDATSVQESSATLNGSISVTNATKDYTVGFFVSTSGTPSSTNYKKKVESGTNKTGNYSSSATDLSANTTYRVRAYALYDGTYYYGETKSFTTSLGTTGTLNGHDWVDLGLPSGTKWATCNVGASSPEQSGGYYAWGETSEKSTYTYNTYIYCNGTELSCQDIGSDISGTSYDVAHQKWGASWKMPTKEQCKELWQNCTTTWITTNGVKGRKFTGPNGNSIFIPAAGIKENGNSYMNTLGYCWSSTVDSYWPSAWGFYIGSDVVTVRYLRRSYGMNVRPVTN